MRVYTYLKLTRQSCHIPRFTHQHLLTLLYYWDILRMFALQAGISYDIFMYHKRPGKQAHYYDIQWYRQTGVFYPEQLSSEAPTVGVSANTWREYMDLIRKAAADHPAHRFISPELMTTAGMELAEIPIPDQHAAVNGRLTKLEELSTSMPTAELVVGTPEYHPDGRIYNSLVIIKNGIHRVLERKRTIFSSSAERGTFTASNTLQQRYTRTLSAVCADLVGYGMQYPQIPQTPPRHPCHSRQLLLGDTARGGSSLCRSAR